MYENNSKSMHMIHYIWIFAIAEIYKKAINKSMNHVIIGYDLTNLTNMSKYITSIYIQPNHLPPYHHNKYSQTHEDGKSHEVNNSRSTRSVIYKVDSSKYIQRKTKSS